MTLSYLNPAGKKVTIRFRGLRNLDVIHDPLGDECEIMYDEKTGVSEKGIKRMVRPKRALEVFQPIRQRKGTPDFMPKEIMDKIQKLLGEKEGRRVRPKRSPSVHQATTAMKEGQLSHKDEL